MIMDSRQIKEIKNLNTGMVKALNLNKIIWEQTFKIPDGMKGFNINNLKYKETEKPLTYKNKDLINYSNRWIIHHNIDEVQKRYDFIKYIKIGIQAGYKNDIGGASYEPIGISTYNYDGKHKLSPSNKDFVKYINKNYFEVDLSDPKIVSKQYLVVTIYTKESSYFVNNSEDIERVMNDLDVIFYY